VGFKQIEPHKTPENKSCSNGPICYCTGECRRPTQKLDNGLNVNEAKKIFGSFFNGGNIIK
jgi:hypothetical protein